jgi:hypothetical protein
MDAAQKHNLVEKKRREKINTKIDELKIIIGLNGNDKVTKYNILDNTIEYIKTLKKENNEYKNKLEKIVKKEDEDIKKITKKIKNIML